MFSDILFFVSSIAWCQKMELRTLGMYAAAVVLTFLGKYTWEVYLK